MFGFLFKIFALGMVVGAIWLLFDFQWNGNELRIRSRYATDRAAEKALESTPKVSEHHPDTSRRQIQKLIQENSK
jgi:hypothetical protein